MTSFVIDYFELPTSDTAVAFVALESTAGGDRVIGVAAYAPDTQEDATFTVAGVFTNSWMSFTITSLKPGALPVIL